jgi:hypothetical protein
MSPLLLLLFACAERAGTVRTSLPSEGRGPATVNPAVPPFELGMMDHVYVVGWSKDSREVGWCMDGMVRRCGFRTVDGAEATLRDRPSPEFDAPDPAMAAAIDARLAANGYGTVRGVWDYAETVALTWRVTPGAEGGPDALLEAGARLAANGRPVYPVSLSEPSFDRIHLEFIGLSPDGKHVGVVSHAFRGEYSDTFRIAIVPAQSLVYAAFAGGASPAN